jgi:hypothetical protein
MLLPGKASEILSKAELGALNEEAAPELIHERS